MTPRILVIWSPVVAAVVLAALLWLLIPGMKPHYPPVQVPAWSFDTALLEKDDAGNTDWPRPARSPFARDGQRLSEMGSSLGHQVPELSLTMMVSARGSSMCRINGKIYREGDGGPGFRVEAIGPDAVRVRLESGEVVTLRLETE